MSAMLGKFSILFFDNMKQLIFGNSYFYLRIELIMSYYDRRQPFT